EPVGSYLDSVVQIGANIIAGSSSTLVVYRARQFVNLFARYRIILDGKKIARIRRGEELRFRIAPGKHQLLARMDWVRSNVFVFDVGDNEEVELEVGS